MTTSVTDKSPISAKVWRRHSDPPNLWIIVTLSSVSLHLLIFWLIRPSGVFRPWFPQQSQSSVPIELVEISPPAKSTVKSNSAAKSVSPPAPSEEQSTPVGLSPTAPATPNNDSDPSLLSRNETKSPPPSPQPFSRAEPTTAPEPKPEPTTTEPEPEPTTASEPKPEPTTTEPRVAATPTPTPTIPFGDRPWERRQEVVLGKETPLPQDAPSIPPDQLQEPPPESEATLPNTGDDTSTTAAGGTANNTSDETPAPTTGETAPNTSDETPAPTTGETPAPTTGETANSNQGGAIATLAALGNDEVRQLIQAGRLRVDGLPDVPAVYNGSNTKNLESSFLPRDSGLQPAQLLVSLVIDQNGNFQQAVVIEIEPGSLQGEKSLYQQVINDIFKNESFAPAQNQDGSQPPLSNLFVRITIEPVNSN